jgi:purine catabolism regulator
MEVPDILNWVEEGEFLLTTVYSMKDDLEGFKELIIHCSHKGLAGMGIKTKRYINEIPDSIIHAANELDFPLIDISYELSFSTIITKILTEILSYEIDSRYRIEFIEDLLSNDDKKYKKALEMASYFDFDCSLKYAVGVIFLKKSYQMEQRLMSVVKKTNAGIYPKIIIGNKSNKIIMLYGVEKGEIDSKVKEGIKLLCDEILRYAKCTSIENIAIGIGRISSDPRELFGSYNDANRTIEYLNNYKHKKFAFFDELGVFRILSSDEVKADLNKLYLDLLGSLIKYDNEKGTEFIDTLISYFKHSGNLKKVSEEMFTHYNTIIYRIQRIKEITGINFEDYDEILNLQIVLKIHELMKYNQ